MTRFNMAALLLATSLMVAACGGESTQSTSTAPGPSAPTEDAIVPGDSMPTATPAPTPSILPITSDDLVEALPTNPMLSKVQGSKFKENKNWDSGSDQGPEWVADAPLSKDQMRQVNIESLRRVKPDKCEAAAAFFAHGWTTKWSMGDYISAVGYAKKANLISAWEDGLLSTWLSQALVMSEGAPQSWTQNLSATINDCTKYTVIAANGDVEKINIVKSESDMGFKVEWQNSAAAIIRTAALEIGGRQGALLQLWEPIGNVLYETQMSIYSDDTKQWARASVLYNKLADSLANAQGIERMGVDLTEGATIIPDSADYSPPASPGGSQA